MSIRRFRLRQSVENSAIRPEAAESDTAAFAGGELSVRKSEAGAAAGLNIVALAGEYRYLACAVIRGILQEEAGSCERCAVVILLFYFQRSRPAEVIPFLRDRNAMLGD